jgi:uncharacterized membrane protein
MAYYVCPTCGAPLTLADPPTLTAHDQLALWRRRLRGEPPQRAICSNCGALERGPLNEEHIRRELRRNLLDWAVAVGLVAVVVVGGIAFFLMSRDPGVNTDVTAALLMAAWTWAIICVVMLVYVLALTLVHTSKAHRLMVAWQPYRREGDATVCQDAHRSSRASGGQSAGGG